MAERQRSQAGKEKAKDNTAGALWAALRTERRRSGERTEMSFCRCGWRDEAAERTQERRRG